MYHQPHIDFTPEEVLVYLRKSRSDDPLQTIEEVLQNHESILDEWTERNLGAKVPPKNKFREVVSGETLKERPEINKVLRLIESPKYKGVAIVEPQRLTRGDLEDIGRLMKLFKHTNTLIITPQRLYDLRDEYDFDAFERELKRGNEYLEYFKKIQNRGRLLSVSQGNYLGSKPPYGYDKIFIQDGKKKCPTLKEKKEEANIVRLIFDLYVNENMGNRKICNHLNALSVKPPKGEYWSPETISEMLCNIHYIGKVKWNWRKTITIVEDSEIIKTRPKAKMGEFLVFEGKHEGIIPEELFNAALAKRGRNHRAKGTTKVQNAFASILRCRCGRAMVLRTNRKNGVDMGTPRLMCAGQTHCHTGSCLYPEMEEKICHVLENCIEDFEVRMQTETGDSVKLHKQLVKNLEEKLKALQAKELAQWEAQSDPDPEKRMPQEIFKQLNSKVLKEKEEVRLALCSAQESIPEPVDYGEKIRHFRDALAALKDPIISAEKKNILLKICIEKITYHRDRPERIKRLPGEKSDKRKFGSNKWTSPPMEIDVDLRV